jgi:hypothetical protein
LTHGRALLAIAALLGLQGAGPLPAQSLTGPTGLVTIPTAGMASDGDVTLGMNLVDARYHGYHGEGREAHHAVVQYATVGFLPFVEVGLRLTRVLDLPRQALGDRFVGVRVRLLEERRHAPAVVAGVHDLLGTRIFHAEYVAASKTLAAGPLGDVGLHLGYGGDWLSIPSRGRQFVGLFGGVALTPAPGVTLLAEHDTERVNAGLRLRVGRLSLLGALLDLEAFSGGVGYTHPLK